METKTIKTNLVVAYFGLKTKRNNPALAGLTRKEIFNLPLDKMPKRAFCQAVTAVNKKYKLTVNPAHLYKIAPAVLISEIGAIFSEYPHLHKKQVIRLFEKMVAAKKETKVFSTTISAPLTIDTIDWLSNYTLKELDYSNIEKAINDGEKITVEDIADFFSAREDRKISKILSRITCPKISRSTIKSFLADCCGIESEEINENNPITTLTPSMGNCGEKDYYVVVFWAEQAFKKAATNRFVETKNIGDLITLLAK